MIFTQRDQAILNDIQNYGILTTRIIASKHFPNVAMTTVLRRLRALESAAYITRVSGLKDAQNGWILTKSTAEQMLPLASKVHFPKFILEHEFALTNLRLKLEAAGIARTWKPEHEIRSRVAQRFGLRRISERVIPDGLMGVETNGRKETIAIEIEFSGKNQRRYRSIFREYANKKNIWAFWHLVGKRMIGHQLMSAAKGSYHGRRSPYFLWSALDDVMADPLNATMNGYEERYLVSQLWTPSPAHLPAQGVSGQKHNTEAKENKLSALIETKTPAPHEV